MQNISTNIWSLGKHRDLKLGEVTSLLSPTILQFIFLIYFSCCVTLKTIYWQEPSTLFRDQLSKSLSSLPEAWCCLFWRSEQPTCFGSRLYLVQCKMNIFDGYMVMSTYTKYRKSLWIYKDRGLVLRSSPWIFEEKRDRSQSTDEWLGLIGISRTRMEMSCKFHRLARITACARKFQHDARPKYKQNSLRRYLALEGRSSSGRNMQAL